VRLVEEVFRVQQPPEVVFDYLTDPSKVVDWQTAKTSVEQLTEGPPRRGTRLRERTKGPRGKEFEQIVEFAEFNRSQRVHVHVVEGPYLVDGTWTFEPAEGGTRLHFVADGELNGFVHPEADRDARARKAVRGVPPEPASQPRGVAALDRDDEIDVGSSAQTEAA
jgi:carbon monoxide dehydrogenase subunit G